VGLIATVLVGVIVLVGIALILALHDEEPRGDQVDHGDLGLPDRTLTADDIPALRFRIGLRGYRMEDVDVALNRVAEALRDAQQTPHK
jgi:DivIVA domain-containing protein